MKSLEDSGSGRQVLDVGLFALQRVSMCNVCPTWSQHVQLLLYKELACATFGMLCSCSWTHITQVFRRATDADHALDNLKNDQNSWCSWHIGTWTLA
jgi:hypothetical protein